MSWKSVFIPLHTVVVFLGYKQKIYSCFFQSFTTSISVFDFTHRSAGGFYQELQIWSPDCPCSHHCNDKTQHTSRLVVKQDQRKLFILNYNNINVNKNIYFKRSPVDFDKLSSEWASNFPRTAKFEMLQPQQFIFIYLSF